MRLLRSAFRIGVKLLPDCVRMFASGMWNRLLSCHIGLAKTRFICEFSEASCELP